MPMKRAVLLSAISAASIAGVSGLATADETGLASSHNLRKERGTTCMADHYHSGYGEGANKAAARAAAAKSWSEFVAFEYGTTWARFGRAASVTTKYTKPEKGWAATVEGRPCR
jgi:hypothetical protein